MNIFKRKQKATESPYFNYMMYGGGYEQMKKDEEERVKSRELFIKELSERVNGCSLCGGRDIGVKVHEDRDGCDSHCYCKDCGHSSKSLFEGADTPESLKKIFLQWHSENNEFDVIITAPKVVTIIKEMSEIADKMDSLEDFDPGDIINRVRMLEKWSGLHK